MAEGNEQPTLLGDESEKKPKRSRSAPGSSAKRAPARKTGGKRPTKSNHLEVAEPSQGQLLETAGRSSNEGNSEIKAADGSVRQAADHSVTKNEGARPEEKPIAGHRTNAALEVAESPEAVPAENGRHRVHSELVVEQPKPEPVYGEGLIEVSGKGFGFLRDPKRNYVQSPQDIFVTPEVVRKHALRDGLWIKGEIRRGSRGPQLFKLTEINGEDPERYRNLPVFEELTSINPTERIRLETVPDRYTTRVMDLMTPIGKGQRGLIVAPPRTGKTTLLQHIADAVVRNHPETSLIILLVDERPEEVTEIRRTVPKADIMASSNDSDIKSHTRIAQLAIERAKRLVEANRDVFVLMDSLTRVGRAFNNASAGSGRTMSGGMDSRAMEIPRKLFAAARNTEEAGSLTIMATALIETGSKMDELIFQEFKGTGNMEMVLDRQISDQRTYPSVDIFKSGTRREELLLPQKDLEKINTIRRGLAGHRPTEAIERLLSFLRKFPTNAQMLREIPG
jgi:transcription termination factor Rho